MKTIKITLPDGLADWLKIQKDGVVILALSRERYQKESLVNFKRGNMLPLSPEKTLRDKP